MVINNFTFFSKLDPNKIESWFNKKIISIDIDWAPDFVLLDTIKLLENSKKKVCFFITHDTPLLKRISSNPNFEMGLHPNFDHVIKRGSKVTPLDILNSLSFVGPKITVLRSHGMTTSGRWLSLFQKFGITHLSNYFMFGVERIRPFHQLNDIIEAPVYFADDGYLYNQSNKIDCIRLLKNLNLLTGGLKVFNFHPIHIYLNAKNLENYNLAKNHFSNEEILESMVESGFGVRKILQNVLDLN